MSLSKLCYVSCINLFGRCSISVSHLRNKSSSQCIPINFAHPGFQNGSFKQCCVFASTSCQTTQLSSPANLQKHLPKVEPEIFSSPKNSLNHLSQILQLKCGIASVFSVSFGSRNRNFVCNVTLNWPEPHTFSAEGPKKRIAEKAACCQALHWLYSNDFITEKSQPNLNHEASQKNNVTVHLSELTLAKLDNVLEMYSKKIAPAISTSPSLKAHSAKQPEGRLHPTLGRPFPTVEDLEMWNQTLSKHKEISTNILPIDKYREIILESIRSNRVTIVKGETGCGKTTKVPQFILDDAIANGHGAYCNIAVVQPRRLTTVESAKYVAKKRGDRIGGSIGYSVKMSSELPSVPGGSITFMTGMKLALKFTSNPSLQGVSHVVLDEVHLRDIGTDLVMMLLKQALKINPNLQVIIMSATVDVSLFQSYFDQWGPVPVVKVPGRVFPVKMHFVDDMPSKLVKFDQTIDEDLPKIDYPMVQRVVSWIHNSKPAGAILVFVAGWNDMTQLQKSLSLEKNLVTISVHGMLGDCSAAFEPAPENIRKVILATNVAETSVTFPDVVYVIDCGVHKRPQRNMLSPGGWSTSKMSTSWITKANVLQRKGRAGRVKPGESYHLFPKAIFENMEDYEPPSILSDSLEHLVLSIKMVDPNKKAEDLLKNFPSPPCSRDVRNTVRTLQAVSLLSHEDEKPTPLAAAVMNVSSSLPAALALIYSAIFRCFDTTLSAISCEEVRLILSSLSYDEPSVERSIKEKYHHTSDHLAKVRAIEDPQTSLGPHPTHRQARGVKKFLHRQINSMSKYLKNADLNEHTNEELVKSILLSSFGSLLVKRHTSSLKTFINDKSGISASIKSRSVNYKLEKFQSPFAMYLSGHVIRGKLLVNDTTVMSPLAVLLFLPSLFQTTNIESGCVKTQAWNNKGVQLLMPQEHLERVQELKKAMKDVRDYFVIAEVLSQPDENFDLLCEFRNHLVKCINDLLTDKK